MSRRIEWNGNHESANQQENKFVEEYLTWPAKKKWQYLMQLAKQGIEKSNTKEPRRIEWK
jgi:hypothetical protein